MARLPQSALTGVALSSGFTHAQLVAFLEARFTACGFPTVFKQDGGTTNPTILAYDINLDSGHTYGRVAFIVYIPQITNNTNFKIYTGLSYYSDFEFDSNNPNPFKFKNDYVNAGGGVQQTSTLPSTYADFELNNENGYTAYSFPTTLEFIGVMLKETTGDADLKAFLGMVHLENYSSVYDRNSNAFVTLVLNDFRTRFIQNAIPNGVSQASLSLHAPFQGETIFTANTGVILSQSFMRVDAGQASSFGRGGQFDKTNVPPFIVYDHFSIDRHSMFFGNLSSDIVVGFSEATTAQKLIVTAGSEEYFVIQNYGASCKASLAIRIDTP